MHQLSETSRISVHWLFQTIGW